jgi:hypothetical protein
MSDIHTADQQEHLWRSRQARVIRGFRKVHRITGVLLFLLFMLIALTGLLLGWKKNSGGYLLPESRTGTSTDLSRWLPVDSLHRLAVGYLRDSVSPGLSPELERIDMRPDKGMVKFVFARHFWGLQLDGATGRLLLIERRRSDFIEKVHDGSIFDHYLGLYGQPGQAALHHLVRLVAAHVHRHRVLALVWPQTHAAAQHAEEGPRTACTFPPSPAPSGWHLTPSRSIRAGMRCAPRRKWNSLPGYDRIDKGINIAGKGRNVRHSGRI